MRSCTATPRGKVTWIPGPAGPYRRIRASTEQAPTLYRSRPLSREWTAMAPGGGQDAGHDS